MVNVSPREFHKKIQDPSSDVICIDVRTGGEHKDVRIPGVVNIPLDEIKEHIDDLKKHKEVYLHCASGKRSEMACKILTDAGLQNICNVSGGIMAYREQGLPVVCKKGGDPQMTVMRQVMIVAGAFIVLGMLGSVFLHPFFVMISWFVGLGLIYGGASGNCMMMKVLLIMPWNKTCK